MRKKLVLWLAVLMLALGPLGLTGRVRASRDPAADFAGSFAEAVSKGKSEVTIKTDETDVNGLIKEVLESYPMLFHYVQSVRWTTWSDRAEVELQLVNTEDPISQIPVVDSEETLRAVLALALAQTKEQTDFVCTNGFRPETDVIVRLLEELRHSDYLAYMGYYSMATNIQTYEGVDIAACQLTLSYKEGMSLQTLRQWREETAAAAEMLLRTEVALDMPDYEKVLRIHDWIVENTRYNLANMEELGNHMAYGALVRGSCVCQGYAEAFMLLANALGVETVYVTGDGWSDGSWESHAWNAVKVQGEWYMLDLTWDDPVTTDGSDVLRYDYFLVSGEQLAQDHAWEAADYPSCPAGSLDADWVLDQAARSTGGYQQYDAGGLVTPEETIERYSNVLAQSGWTLPGQTPEQTQPPATAPVADLPTSPAEETEPVVLPEPEPQEPERNGGWIIVLVIALILAGLGGGGAVIVTRRREAQRRRRRQGRSMTVEFRSDRNW